MDRSPDTPIIAQRGRRLVTATLNVQLTKPRQAEVRPPSASHRGDRSSRPEGSLGIFRLCVCPGARLMRLLPSFLTIVVGVLHS